MIDDLGAAVGRRALVATGAALEAQPSGKGKVAAMVRQSRTGVTRLAERPAVFEAPNLDLPQDGECCLAALGII
jgi:hypothetical protein